MASLDDRDFSIAVREADAQLSKALAELRNAEANYERVRELYENDNLSKSELSSARATAESAKAQVGVARQSLTNTKLQLSYAVIRAPEDCEVEQTFFKVNENVTSGQAVVRLNCGTCVDVRVSVPETQIGSMRLGEAANVSLAAIPGQVFKATVDEIGVAMSSESRAFPLVVKVDEGCDVIRPGRCGIHASFRPAEQPDTCSLGRGWGRSKRTLRLCPGINRRDLRHR